MFPCEQCEILQVALATGSKAHGECVDVLNGLLNGTMTEATLRVFVQENERNIAALEGLKAQLEAMAVKNGALS